MTTITSTDAPAAGSGTSAGKPPSTKREIGVLSGFAHVALILWALAPKEEGMAAVAALGALVLALAAALPRPTR